MSDLEDIDLKTPGVGGKSTPVKEKRRKRVSIKTSKDKKGVNGKQHKQKDKSGKNSTIPDTGESIALRAKRNVKKKQQSGDDSLGDNIEVTGQNPGGDGQSTKNEIDSDNVEPTVDLQSPTPPLGILKKPTVVDPTAGDKFLAWFLDRKERFVGFDFNEEIEKIIFAVEKQFRGNLHNMSIDDIKNYCDNRNSRFSFEEIRAYYNGLTTFKRESKERELLLKNEAADNIFRERYVTGLGHMRQLEDEIYNYGCNGIECDHLFKQHEELKNSIYSIYHSTNSFGETNWLDAPKITDPDALWELGAEMRNDKESIRNKLLGFVRDGDSEAFKAGCDAAKDIFNTDEQARIFGECYKLFVKIKKDEFKEEQEKMNEERKEKNEEIRRINISFEDRLKQRNGGSGGGFLPSFHKKILNKRKKKKKLDSSAARAELLARLKNSKLTSRQRKKIRHKLDVINQAATAAFGSKGYLAAQKIIDQIENKLKSKKLGKLDKLDKLGSKLGSTIEHDDNGEPVKKRRRKNKGDKRLSEAAETTLAQVAFFVYISLFIFFYLECSGC